VTDRELEEEVLGYLSKLPRWPGRDRLEQSSKGLVEGKVLDSVGLLEFVTYLEGLCRIEIPSEDITGDNFDSVARIIRYLGRERGVTGVAD
jgi:acyl carrier protein